MNILIRCICRICDYFCSIGNTNHLNMRSNYILNYSQEKDCFLYTHKYVGSTSGAHDKEPVVKITHHKSKEPFYTLNKARVTEICKDNKACYINKTLARYLELKKDDPVQLEIVDRNQQKNLKKVHVRISREDHEKAEACARILEDTILDKVKCVSENSKIPLWINDHITISVDIVKLEPSCEVGILTDHTGVHLEPPAEPIPVKKDFNTMFMSLFSNYFKPIPVEMNFDDFEIRPKYARICSLGSLKPDLKQDSKIHEDFHSVFVNTKSKTHQTLKVSKSHPNFVFNQVNFKAEAETDRKFLGRIYELDDTLSCLADSKSTDSVGLDTENGNRNPSNQKIDSDLGIQSSNEGDLLLIYMEKELLTQLKLEVGAKFELSEYINQNKKSSNDQINKPGDENNKSSKREVVESMGFNREKLFLNHLDSTLSSLVKQIRHSLRNGRLYRDNILLWGSEGCGKTTMCRTLQEDLQNAGPDSIHCQVIDCKPMKGKISNNIEKQLRDIMSHACYMEPACVILDQVDILCSHPKESLDMAAIIQSYKVCSLFVSVVREFQMNNNIMIIGVTSNKDLIKSTRASLVFSHCSSLPSLDQTNRSLLVRKLIHSKLNSNWFKINDIDVDKVSKKCEGYSIQDMCDIVDKAMFHYLHNLVDEPPAPVDNNATTAELPKIKLFSTEDLEDSLQSHVPLALKGIKMDPVEATDFSHVGGLESAKQLLIETLVWPSMYPELFSQCPLKPQSGILLYGAPGTGKTLLASAISGECGLKFISVQGPELFSKFIGESEEGVRNIFNRARSIQPCILFFDEFDSLAAKRGNDSTGVKDRVVNQLLTELDGVEGLEGVYVVGATSRPDIIDPALLRPGRLGTAVHCTVPDQGEREEILRVLSQQVKLASDVNLTEIAKATENFTGADLRGLLCSAQMLTEDTNEESSEDPAICQADLLKVLEDTKPSLSPLDNLKFTQVYTSFVNKKGLSSEEMQKQKVISA